MDKVAVRVGGVWVRGHGHWAEPRRGMGWTLAWAAAVVARTAAPQLGTGRREAAKGLLTEKAWRMSHPKKRKGERAHRGALRLGGGAGGSEAVRGPA